MLSVGAPPPLLCPVTTPALARTAPEKNMASPAGYLLKRRVDWPSLPYVILGEDLTSVVQGSVSGLISNPLEV